MLLTKLIVSNMIKEHNLRNWTVLAFDWTVFVNNYTLILPRYITSFKDRYISYTLPIFYLHSTESLRRFEYARFMIKNYYLCLYMFYHLNVKVYFTFKNILHYKFQVEKIMNICIFSAIICIFSVNLCWTCGVNMLYIC